MKPPIENVQCKCWNIDATPRRATPRHAVPCNAKQCRLLLWRTTCRKPIERLWTANSSAKAEKIHRQKVRRGKTKPWTSPNQKQNQNQNRAGPRRNCSARSIHRTIPLRKANISWRLAYGFVEDSHWDWAAFAPLAADADAKHMMRMRMVVAGWEMRLLGGGLMPVKATYWILMRIDFDLKQRNVQNLAHAPTHTRTRVHPHTHKHTLCL